MNFDRVSSRVRPLLVSCSFSYWVAMVWVAICVTSEGVEWGGVMGGDV
jgi:hypothetical protein